MAKNKKSFLLYADMQSLFSKLPDEIAGKLIKLIFSYVNDENPIIDNLLLEIAFEPIKTQLKRDLKGWYEMQKERSQAGAMGNLKRWHDDLYKEVQAGETTLEEAVIVANGRKVSHSDNSNRKASQTVANIAVNVNDNVNVNDIIKKNINKKKEWDYEFVFNFVVTEKNYPEALAVKIFDYYKTNDWKDSNNKPIKNLKQKIIGVWLNEDNRKKFTNIPASSLNITDTAIAKDIELFNSRRQKRDLSTYPHDLQE